MTQKRFIVHNKPGTYNGPLYQYGQADRIHVLEPEIDKVVSSRHVEGLGTIRQVKGTGRYRKSHLTLRSVDGERWPGHKLDYAMFVDRSAAGVRQFVRRLREQEAAELDTIDTEVAALLERVTVLRQQRREVMARAWARGNVVRLNEIEAALAHDHRGVFSEGAVLEGEEAD